MTVTISVPFYCRRDYLRRCIDSLLAQTYDDLKVLVVADGKPVGPLPSDPRLQVYRLPQNRGAYYARAVALEATTTSHHAIVDADDWVDEDWLETMLATGGSAVQHGSRMTHYPDGRADHDVWRGARRHLATKLLHYTSHTGVYETERLREVGGYSPAYRMGYDSLLCALLRMAGPVEIVDRPMYHRFRHPDSLCNAPATQIGSPVRLQARAELEVVYRDAYAHRGDVDKIRSIALAATPDRLWEEVRRHADRIR